MDTKTEKKAPPAPPADKPVELPDAPTLYAQYEAKLKSTKALDDKTRKLAIEKLPAHKDDVKYLKGKLAQILGREEELAEASAQVGNVFDDEAPDAVPQGGQA